MKYCSLDIGKHCRHFFASWEDSTIECIKQGTKITNNKKPNSPHSPFKIGKRILCKQRTYMTRSEKRNIYVSKYESLDTRINYSFQS